MWDERRWGMWDGDGEYGVWLANQHLTDAHLICGREIDWCEKGNSLISEQSHSIGIMKAVNER